MSGFFSKLKHVDIPLLITMMLLIICGLAAMYSIAATSGSMTLLFRQIVFVIIGGVFFIFFASYNYHNISKWHRVAYVLVIAALIGVLILGRDIRGSSRWIDIGFFNLQPAEFAKLVVAVGLSRWLYLKRGQINSWKNIVLSLAYALIPAILILREPDLGSTLIVLGIWFGLILVSPMKKRFVIALFVVALLFSATSWQFLLHDYQRKRIEVFIDPALDPRGQGYNVRQAVIAVGSGHVIGRGFGQGLQSTLRFLPERQTDFVFATMSEEVGFVGSVTIVFLYGFLMLRLLKVVRMARDDFGMYLAAGVLCMMFGQVLINIGMNIGIMPVTGIPLPLITHGGSSLLVTMIALGIVQNIAIQSKTLRF
jgi:rod shape determining protein RodA